MKLDTYYITARVLPTLLGVVPFYVIQYFFLNPVLKGLWSDIMGIKIAANTTFSIALFFLLLQSGRYVSKILEDKVFKKGLNFPSTSYLLYLDETYSKDYKEKIHKKIKKDFDINLSSIESERLNEYQARKLVSEAVAHIRASVKRGRLVGQHNDEYGFVRNLTGLSFISSWMSFIDLLFFAFIYPDPMGFMFSVILFFIYIVYYLLSAKITEFIGRNYAQVLIQEYMTGRF
jgi:hypothetical protein